MDAETHGRMLQRLGGEVREFLARSNQATVGELVEFVGGVEARLSALEGPVEAVLSHFPDWPAVRSPVPPFPLGRGTGSTTGKRMEGKITYHTSP